MTYFETLNLSVNVIIFNEEQDQHGKGNQVKSKAFNLNEIKCFDSVQSEVHSHMKERLSK